MIKSFDFEEKFFRAKVPIPFVEDNFYLPAKVFIEGYFPAGTVFKFQEAVCSKKIDVYNDQVNDYCHAVSFLYSNKFKGNESPDEEDEYKVIFHVDLSALFLLLEPIDENGNVIEI
ncbi:MAG: hypothetical protein IJT73_03315 [Selenomonadaceae bacterium]|nr:hypothetical protein [Selenomonadaceae bacterium]